MTTYSSKTEWKHKIGKLSQKFFNESLLHLSLICSYDNCRLGVEDHQTTTPTTANLM